MENELWKAWTDYVRGWVHYDRGEHELSQKCFKNWHDIMAKNFPSSMPFFQALYSVYLGLLDLERGRNDSAESRLAEVKSQIPKVNPPTETRIKFRYDLLSTEILLANGSVEDAVSVGEKMSSLGVIRSMFSWYVISYNVPILKDVLARAYIQKGEFDKAITVYERFILFDPKSPERFLIHPKYHYRMARLYEQKGQMDKAKEHYEKFLDLWKDADPGILEVEDAKKRLAGLKA